MISILLAVVMVASMFSVLPISASADSVDSGSLLGDVDGDGAVDVVDATLIQRYIAEMIELNAGQLKAADVDGDGEVTVLDATWIQRYLIGLPAPEGIGQPCPADKHEITDATYPLYRDADDTGMRMKLYFVDGADDLPYIDAADFGDLVNNFYDNSKKDVSFPLETEGNTATYTRTSDVPDAVDNGATMVLDFENDTISFNDYNLFCYRKSAATLLDMVTLNVFNDKGEPVLLEKVDTGIYPRYGKAVELDLRDYGIDLIAQDGLYLIPLQTVSDLVMTNADMGGFYFNGQCVILSTDVSDCADFYYSAPTGERSQALAEYGYGELCLLLDTFYGLKEPHNIDSFAKLFHDTGLESALKGSDVNKADEAVYRLISDYLSDGHSKWHASSYLTGPAEYTARDLTREKVLESKSRQTSARAKYYPEGIPGYEEVGNTAYITFDSFNNLIPDSDEYYKIEDPQAFPDADIYGLIIKAHAMITRENSPIENVVLDLSANTGGKDNVAAYVMSWFLGETAVTTLDTMTGAQCTSICKADVNRDRKFDETDTVADKNLFCLISPCSFSNGNFVPCMLKQSGKVTLLGRTSAGGSCSVQNASTAWGTSFQISCPLRVSFLKNGSLYDVDRGADPDVVLPTPDQYYDRAYLTKYINDLCGKE